MTIAVGDSIPSVDLREMREDGPSVVNLAEFCAGKKVVLFAVPGAYTPTCSAQHLPGFISNANTILAKGIDAILCVSVNDVFVMSYWGREHGAGDQVTLLADGNGDLARETGLEMDGTSFGMGTRLKRFAMIIDDGKVTELNVEEPGAFEVSKAETILSLL